MDTYQSIEAEKRTGDSKISARYSKHVKDNEQKERFSKTKSNSKEKKFKLTKGVSMNKSEWDVLNVDKVMDEEVKGETKSPYKTHNVKTVFEDFDYIDIKKLGGAPKKSSKKSSKKKGDSAKKSSVKKSSAKKSSKKKGGSAKKSSRKKSDSAKKSSRKKSSSSKRSTR